MLEKILPAIFILLSACAPENRGAFNAYLEPAEINSAPGGEYSVFVKIEIPANSYIYGNPLGPGTGKATEVTAAPHDFIYMGKPVFAPAKKYKAIGEDDFVYVYRKEALISLPLRIDEKAPPGKAELSVNLEALICNNNSCEPVTRSLSLPVFVGGAAIKAAQAEEAADAPLRAASSAAADLHTTEFKARLIGGSPVKGLIQAIFFGLAAGFILNFMPCVLPVIGIKIMAFMRRARGSRRELAKHGGAFALGILSAFLVLAGLSSFAGYNWGALFQNEYFLRAMTALVFALALSLLGAFSLNVPSFAGRAAKEGTGLADAFCKGLLAALLAAPCSGPLLGGTLAWAMTQQPLIVFVIFISVGAGMALPYLLLCVFPGLADKIPKPGEWMRLLELVMGFLLVFTVIYLLSIFPDGNLLPMLTFIGFTAAACCLYGRYAAALCAKKTRITASVFAVFILSAGWFLSFNFLYEKEEKISAALRNDFSMERLVHNRELGIISIVVFTADWCPNCKFVESISLKTKKVQEAVKRSGAELLTADITRPFPEAEKLLRDLGSRSIPFLAVMPPGGAFTSPLCLADIYSEEDVLRAIREAGGEY